MKSLIETALTQYGVREVVGTSNNPKIVNYSKEAGFSSINDDETAWCSVFMNWVAFKTGYERSQRLDARSWMLIGAPVLFPEVGDVVILKRGNSEWQGHVGIFINAIGETVYVLGGNQSDMVNIAPFKKSEVLGFRRLRKLSDL